MAASVVIGNSGALIAQDLTGRSVRNCGEVVQLHSNERLQMG